MSDAEIVLFQANTRAAGALKRAEDGVARALEQRELQREWKSFIAGIHFDASRHVFVDAHGCTANASLGLDAIYGLWSKHDERTALSERGPSDG